MLYTRRTSAISWGCGRSWSSDSLVCRPRMWTAERFGQEFIRATGLEHLVTAWPKVPLCIESGTAARPNQHSAAVQVLEEDPEGLRGFRIA